MSTNRNFFKRKESRRNEAMSSAYQPNAGLVFMTQFHIEEKFNNIVCRNSNTTTATTTTTATAAAASAAAAATTTFMTLHTF